MVVVFFRGWEDLRKVIPGGRVKHSDTILLVFVVIISPECFTPTNIGQILVLFIVEGLVGTFFFVDFTAGGENHIGFWG